MKIKQGDIFPNVDTFQVSENGPEAVSTKKLLENKRVLLIGVPGAFTPTCAKDHLPGFIKNIDNFFNKGIDKIYVVSVNDPFVMESWIKSYEKKQINYFADSNGDLMKKSGFSLDLSVIGLGMRLSRFVMIIDNCVVKKIFDENGGGLEKSKAEVILESI
ncbi:MAG: peroxiredoxin [Rickettsiales bacterium]|nr:peroxiredoxin [Rickettsiales bacterium]